MAGLEHTERASAILRGSGIRIAELLDTGFTETLAAAGAALVDREIVGLPSSIEAGRDGRERILPRTPALDAVYFSNDDMAIGGYFLCLSRRIAMPDRLALFGHNGLDVGRVTPQPLSTIRAPRVLVGAEGARLVCSDEPSVVINLGLELVEGATA